MHRPSKSALKAWEKLKKAELASRIANLRSETAAQISSKRRAVKEGKLCSTSTAAPKKRRTKKKRKAAPPAPRRAVKRPKKRAAKRSTKRTKKRGAKRR